MQLYHTTDVHDSICCSMLVLFFSYGLMNPAATKEFCTCTACNRIVCTLAYREFNFLLRSWIQKKCAKCSQSEFETENGLQFYFTICLSWLRWIVFLQEGFIDGNRAAAVVVSGMSIQEAREKSITMDHHVLLHCKSLRTFYLTHANA